MFPHDSKSHQIFIGNQKCPFLRFKSSRRMKFHSFSKVILVFLLFCFSSEVFLSWAKTRKKLLFPTLLSLFSLSAFYLRVFDTIYLLYLFKERHRKSFKTKCKKKSLNFHRLNSNFLDRCWPHVGWSLSAVPQFE